MRKIQVSRKKVKGFALIEIAVAILVTAILGSASIPVITRVRAQGQESSCKSNLKTISTALEMSSIDNGGNYPNTLVNLAPSYLNNMPTCPSAGSSTYVNGYTNAVNPASYTVACSGSFHSYLGLAPNMPQYISGVGIIEVMGTNGGRILTPAQLLALTNLQIAQVTAQAAAAAAARAQAAAQLALQNLTQARLAARQAARTAATLTAAARLSAAQAAQLQRTATRAAQTAAAAQLAAARAAQTAARLGTAAAISAATRAATRASLLTQTAQTAATQAQTARTAATQSAILAAAARATSTQAAQTLQTTTTAARQSTQTARSSTTTAAQTAVAAQSALAAAIRIGAYP
ncbi:MAG: hypothetical protein HYU63_05695 [Armatimonadetes bacterium]|nr:hypothetical protein [Armatimonadota bacterium]